MISYILKSATQSITNALVIFTYCFNAFKKYACNLKMYSSVHLFVCYYSTILAYLLFHHKRGCLLRCANVNGPARSAVAIIVNKLDTCILPNTFINF